MAERSAMSCFQNGEIMTPTNMYEHSKSFSKASKLATPSTNGSI